INERNPDSNLSYIRFIFSLLQLFEYLNTETTRRFIFYRPKSNIMGYMNILDELELLISHDSVQSEMRDNVLPREISKLAALAQIQDALLRHQPLIHDQLQDVQAILRPHRERLKLINDLNGYLEGTSLGPYTKPANAFIYPVGRKDTLQQIEQMRRAETRLEAFWDQVDGTDIYYHRRAAYPALDEAKDKRRGIPSDEVRQN
ncbi:MAG: hypothetical protein Q9212_001527, partial [Teloschistes hypoglaucus]